MRRSVGSRWSSKFAALLVAFALVLTGIVAPASAESTGDEVTLPEDGITVTPSRDRWWYGQTVSFEVEVVRDNQPATGRVRLLRDGRNMGGYYFSDGRITIRPTVPAIPAGTWTLTFAHEAVDPETSRWTTYSTTSLQVIVEQPTVPVLSPDSWWAGESHPLRFDVTGTDEPQTGVVELSLPGNDLQAELVNGVATFPHNGAEQFGFGVPWSLTFRHRDVTTGDLVAEWSLPVDVRRKPVEMSVHVPSTWQHGATVTIPVTVSSPHGVPQGVVTVADVTGLPRPYLASTSLVSGKATLTIPATSVPAGTRKIRVDFDAKTVEFADASRESTVTVKKPRPTTVSVHTADVWTYAQPRRVAATVTAGGPTPRGTVELYWAGTGARVGVGTLVDGKASIVVKGKKVDAGRRKIVAKYLGAPTFAPSQHAWSQRVRRAQPTVRLSLDRTRIPYSKVFDTNVYATVTVTTPNMPEAGRLCLQLRDPSADDDRWSWCWAPGQGTTFLAPADDGKKRIRIPGHILYREDNRTGPIYVRYTYNPGNLNVRSARSNVVDVVLYH